MALSGAEAQRYARHLVLKGFGGPAQQALKRASVLVVGAGGLGSPAVAYLAAAGIGRLGIADHDSVALSNLQRQIAHGMGDLGANKAESAAGFVGRLNPHVAVTAHAMRVDARNAAGLVADHDLVLDGTDELASRRVVADACRAARRPLVSGAVSMVDGQVSVFAPHLMRADGRPGPDFRELYPETARDDALPSCEATGVLGPVTGVIGTLMAMEAIKLITRTGAPLIGRLLVYEGLAARFREFSF